MTDFMAGAVAQFNWSKTTGYIKPNGRIQNQYYTFSAGTGYGFQPSEANLTEGQSYGMLAAVWMDDLYTFNLIWQWTKANMQLNANAIAASRQGNVTALNAYLNRAGQRAFSDLGRSTLNLFGWIYKTNWDASQNTNPRSGLSFCDNATDGDVFIAAALCLAYERWGYTTYLADAQAIIADLATFCVRLANGHYYLNMGSYVGWETSTQIGDDPSYNVPWMFSLFAKYDTGNAAIWNDLAATAYSVVNLSKGLHALNMPTYVAGINKTTAAVAPFAGGNNDYNFDAFRIWPNLMMDNDSAGSGISIMNDTTRGLWQWYVANQRVPEVMLANGTVQYNGGSPNYSPWGCCALLAQMYALGIGITVGMTNFANYDAWYTALPSNIKQNAFGYFWDSSDYYANWPWFLTFFAIGSQWRLHHNQKKWLVFSAGTLAANKASFDTLNTAIDTALGYPSATSTTYSKYYIFQDNVQVAIPVLGKAYNSLSAPQKTALVGLLPAGVWTGTG